MLPMGADGADAGQVNGMADQDRPDGSDQPEDVRNFAEADEELDVVDTAPRGDELDDDEVAAIRASQADPRTPPADAPVG
jgi:hypothetical protein